MAPCGAPALCIIMALCGAPSAPKNNKGALGINGKASPCMVIGARVPGGKLGPKMSRGAATLLLCTRSGALNMEPRGGAGAHVNNVKHCGTDTKTSVVRACSAPTMADVASTGPCMN